MMEPASLRVANALLLIFNQNQNKRPYENEHGEGQVDQEQYNLAAKKHKASDVIKKKPLTPCNRNFLHGWADGISMTFAKAASVDPDSFTSSKTLFSLHHQDRIHEKRLRDRLAAERALQQAREQAEEEEERRLMKEKAEKARQEALARRLKEDAERKRAVEEERRLEEIEMMMSEEEHVHEATRYERAMEEKAERELQEAVCTAIEVMVAAYEHTLDTISWMEKAVAEEEAAFKGRKAEEEARIKREEEERLRRLEEEARLEREAAAAEKARRKKEATARAKKAAEKAEKEARRKREAEERVRVKREAEAKRKEQEEARARKAAEKAAEAARIKKEQEAARERARLEKEQAKEQARLAKELAKEQAKLAKEEAKLAKEQARLAKREQKKQQKKLEKQEKDSSQQEGARKRGRPAKNPSTKNPAAKRKKHTCGAVTADDFVTGGSKSSSSDGADTSVVTVSSGDRIMFRFAERDCWAVGVVRHACAKAKARGKKTKRPDSGSGGGSADRHHWFNVFFAASPDKSLLVLNLTPEGKGTDWLFVHDVAPVAWRKALKCGDELEMLDAATKTQWVRGRVTAVRGAHGDSLALQELDSPGKKGYTTPRLAGCDFAPPLTFIANTEADEDDHHSLCTKCGIGGDVLLCDAPGCPCVWHQHCVPGMGEVPEGDWFCPAHDNRT